MRNTAATPLSVTAATEPAVCVQTVPDRSQQTTGSRGRRALVTTDLLEHCVDHVVVLHFQLRPHAPRQRPLLRVELCTRR